MTRVLCVVGLPGSGKTHITEFIKKNEKVLLIDDIKSVDELPAEGLYDIVVITDPNFCRTEVRKNAEIFLFLRYGHEIEWFFFENAPEKCKKNVLYRDDGRKVNSFIDMLSKEYIIPEGAKAVKIWQPDEAK